LQLRTLISHFAVALAIALMIALDTIIEIPTTKLQVPATFTVGNFYANLSKHIQPTWSGRGWVVNPFKNPTWTYFAAILPAIFGTILLFMDHQVNYK
jgi:hypothetical protein